MTRMTITQLERKVDSVNRALGFDPDTIKYYTVGAVRLDRAYGGTKVVKIMSESGGITNLSQDGYGTMRQAATFLDGMLATLETPLTRL